VSLSLYGDADLGAPWDSAGARLTNLYAGLRTALPLGFRGSLGVETHQAVRLWESFVPGDTMPLPGRLTGFTGSLGHDVGGVAVDASGGWLKRAGDPEATLRGSLTLSRRALYASGTWQRGALLDYAALMGRVVLPRRLPVTVSLGALAAMTQPRGGTAVWRVSLRPELARSIGGAWYVTAGGDIGRYAGMTTTWLHAGVSYRFQR
jgi:hypothetical protein